MMFANFHHTKGATRVTSLLGDDSTVLKEGEISAEKEDVQIFNAILSASVILQDASVSNCILSGKFVFFISHKFGSTILR
jgi:hypothetical protein